MEKLFLKLLNMSLTAGWLVLAILLLRPLLKKAPRWVSCALWGLVALRLLLPFSIESGFSLLPTDQPVPPSVVYEEPTTQVNPPVVDTPVVDTPIVDDPVVDTPVVDDPVVDDPVVDTPVVDTPVVDTPIVDTPVVDDPVVDTPVVDAPVVESPAPVVPAPVPAKTPVQKATTALAWVWVGGLIALLIYALDTYICLHLRLRGAVREQGKVWRSERIRTPFVLGVFRPRVYLPFGLTDRELPHVLAHEQAHIARRDHLIKPFGFLLLSVYWFNPLLWVAYTLLCRDIELACDERVIKTMAEEERRAYSSALLDCSIRRLTIAAYPLAFGEVGVKERVKHVLNYKKPAFWIVAVAIVACVALTVGFMTVPKKDTNAPTKKPTTGETTTSTTTGSTTATTTETTVQSTTTEPTAEPTAKPTEPPKEPMPVTYTFDAATGVLTVMGDGVAENIYPHHKKDKEEEDNGTVKKVVIGEGITHVKNCFNHLIMLESIQFPSTLRTIEESFIECGNTYYEGGRYVNVNIPANVKKICNQSFQCTGFESLVFNGPVEIGHVNVFDLAHFREDDTLVIPSGSVLCSAFRNTLGLTEIILESNVTFCDAKHDDSHEHQSFSTIYEEARVYAYAPTYEGNTLVGDWPDPLISSCFGTMKYYPVVIPKGKSIEDYRDKFKKDGAFEERSYYGWKPASNRKDKNFQCRLPADLPVVVVQDHGNFTTRLDAVTGVLTVSGEGMVENLYPHHENDMNGYDNGTVKQVIIEEGITYIKNSFNHLVMLESVRFPSTLHTIDECFVEIGNTENYLEDGQWKQHEAADVIIPATVKKIFNQSFTAAKLDTLIFEGPIEISCPGAFEYVTLQNRLVIPGGSVLCDAFDYVLGESDLVLGPGVVFPDHEQHECDVKEDTYYDEDNKSFTWWSGYAKEVVCRPLYKKGSEMTEEEIRSFFGAKWFPIIVPEGEALADYDNGTYEQNEEWWTEEGPSVWSPWEYRDGMYPIRFPPFV